MRPILRPAGAGDLEYVYQIYMDPSVNPFMSWEPMERGAFRPIFNELMASNDLQVAILNEEVVGIIRIERKAHRRAHVAYLGGFAVHPKFQGTGIGKQIIEDVIDLLTKERRTRIELVVESDNQRAIQFYQKLGFEIEGTMKQYFKRRADATFIDDYFMAKILPAAECSFAAGSE